MPFGKCMHCGQPLELEEDCQSFGLACNDCEDVYTNVPEIDEHSDADPGL